ncbi:spore cortex-lytic enzyme [Metabacillus fastidiosus]|uniref:spore cortex-lytic enzyme n=2 Tax=Metabacillus fastidiosus TaxID=1458 RepID=UPI0008243A9D|nr:spore cortex-lytic enzyme [Metabacillus fastidiosus]MED4462904.1 spore cortex-lytic enzyme [Metabacillus fastidiosus]
MKIIIKMCMASLLLLTAIVFQLFFGSIPKADAFSGQVIQRGATGEDVIELQARLQYNGYYHGKIDGVYGWSTYWAVRNFQQQFELDNVDGLVGQKTKNMLANSTKFYSGFVYKQINKGNDFTHYGGVPLSIQAAPTKEQQAKLRQQAEGTKQKYIAEHTKQGGQAAENKQQQANQQARENKQEQANQQARENKQEQANQQARENKQEQANQQAREDKQQQANQQARENKQEQANQQARENKQEQANQQARENKQQQANQQQAVQKKEKQKTAAANVPGGYSQNDIQLMANAVYGEARGESYVGQVAIAAVILNRVNSPTFPNTVAGVIFEPRAFTAVADGQIYLTPNDQAKKAVIDALNGFDPTGNATYYFNPATATSGWVWGRPQIKQIGKHIFCR